MKKLIHRLSLQALYSFRMNEDDCSYLIRGAIFKVYHTLRAGLFKSVYELALMYEFNKMCLPAQNQVSLPVLYGNVKLDGGYKMDILVNELLIIEIKSIEKLLDVHHKQLMTYLKLSGKKLGLLVNFNSANISQYIFRKVNGL